MLASKRELPTSSGALGLRNWKSEIKLSWQEIKLKWLWKQSYGKFRNVSGRNGNLSRSLISSPISLRNSHLTAYREFFSLASFKYYIANIISITTTLPRSSAKCMYRSENESMRCYFFLACKLRAIKALSTKKFFFCLMKCFQSPFASVSFITMIQLHYARVANWISLARSYFV